MSPTENEGIHEVGDSWPGDRKEIKGIGPRTMQNSEIRPYSWPSVLVFVSRWEPATKFAPGGGHNPDQMVPPTLYLRDGRRVPVCIIEAPRDSESSTAPEAVRYPLNNIGSGNPVVLDVQNRTHVATVACLVTDGHKAYALTNRHVAGDQGQIVSSRLNGRLQAIGVAASKKPHSRSDVRNLSWLAG